MTFQVEAERLIAAAEAEIDACARRRRGMNMLLRDIERRAERARKSSANARVHIREAAEIRCEVLTSVVVRMREALK